MADTSNNDGGGGYSVGGGLRSLIANIARAATPAVQAATYAANPGRAIQAAVPTFNDFMQGLAGNARQWDSAFLGGSVGAPRGSVTVPLPAAVPASAADPAAVPSRAAVAAAKAAPKSPVAAGASQPQMDPKLAAAIGGLTFRQLATLGEFAHNVQPVGPAARESSGPDIAARLMIQNTYPTFQSMMKAAPDDATRSKINDEYNKSVLLPVITRGNVGPVDLYGNGAAGGG